MYANDRSLCPFVSKLIKSNYRVRDTEYEASFYMESQAEIYGKIVNSGVVILNLL